MRLIVTSLCFAIVTAFPGFGQVTTATFYGIITDPSGSRIASATVSFAHVETGAVAKKTADQTGAEPRTVLPHFRQRQTGTR